MPDPIQRPDFRVVLRILEVLWRNATPMRRTRLQQASGTNYTQFERYLDLLVARGLVELRAGDEGGVSVALTPKGFEAHQFLVKGLRDLFSERSLG
ncbi:MAG TPA: winged helix-turn-helix domain-containing protein [Thermoplasmata archaeon]|nr:winged helix-turn-helix domain-containing protein [Thermoplasmata archaeon]